MVSGRPVGSVAWTIAAFFCAALVFAVQPALAQTEIPPLTGRVMDPAEILSASTEQTLTELLRAHEDTTSNQIVVATVPSLDGEAIEEYALRAGRAWQIGTAERDNGILLIVAPSERKVRIEVGYGLEGAVPDAIAAQIIRKEIIPEFRDGDFDAGVAAGTMAILEAVRGEYEADDASSGSGGPPPLVVRIILSIVFGMLLVGVSFAVILAKSPVRWILMTFLTPFAFVVGGIGGMSLWSGLLAAVIFVGLFIYLSGRESVRRLREHVLEASKKDERVPVAVGPFTMYVGGASAGGSGGGGSFGGGGFSGGGGSFGGGGASGGW